MFVHSVHIFPYLEVSQLSNGIQAGDLINEHAAILCAHIPTCKLSDFRTLENVTKLQ